ncbi:hypothetical protein MAR_021630 [Mya arenaria]|uniref:Uncharacterized protein n=1 Tax=Mya arenaria TaxID=6604 RepID=A0ABY7EBJ7_MYAAR|nr:hypothetical protein MAR_021630 [Mya arenaria]
MYTDILFKNYKRRAGNQSVFGSRFWQFSIDLYELQPELKSELNVNFFASIWYLGIQKPYTKLIYVAGVKCCVSVFKIRHGLRTLYAVTYLYYLVFRDH